MELDAYWYEDADWHGYLPIEPVSALLDRHVFQTWVAGLRCYGAAETDPSFAPGCPLRLTPDPYNPFDPNAIAVWNADSTQQAGHIPRYIADDLDPVRDRTALALFEQMEAGRRVNLGHPCQSGATLAPADSRHGQTHGMGCSHRREAQSLGRRYARAARTAGDPMEQMWRMAEGHEKPRDE